MTPLFLGIDTSNYTTSLALVTADGNVVASEKMLLPVKAGERGLRQSDALFHHTRQLPLLFEKIKPLLDGADLRGVGVSTKPRPGEDSYMPVFLAGKTVADAIGATKNIPVLPFSHQEGHVMSAIVGAQAFDLLEAPFVAFHVSGGTTDGMLVTPRTDGFDIEMLSTSADLHAGQLVDRIGVLMGLPFPAGMHLEKLALQNDKPLPTVPRQKADEEGNVHLSGIENKAQALFAKTSDAPLVADYVQCILGKTLLALTEATVTVASSKLGVKTTSIPLLYAGGVMSNGYLQGVLSKQQNPTFFAPPALSSDNAVGIAELTRRRLV